MRLGKFWRAKASGDLLFDFCHPDLLFSNVIGEADIRVPNEAQHGLFMFDEALMPVVGGGLGNASAFAFWRWRQCWQFLATCR
ncbi:MAG: hypothetical protein OXE94_04435 [Aestuariivita sp.]|nr:hypothetical protein [Aestuariivita sp.]